MAKAAIVALPGKKKSRYAGKLLQRGGDCVDTAAATRERGKGLSSSTIWMDAALLCESPNCNERPLDTEVSLLVIHNISLPPGEFGGDCIRQFFCNQLDCSAHSYFAQLQDLQVSAHLLIERDGSLTQFVPFALRAWHAGESSFAGRPQCNDYSIGIELEGTDTQAYTDAQYMQLAGVSRYLMQMFPALNPQRIVGHCDIAPGRKTDPGAAFDWQRYHALLNQQE